MDDSSGTGLDFTGHLRRLCAEIATRLDEFAHVDLTRVAIRWCQARQRSRYGIQASLTPLRFKAGAQETTRRGRRFTIRPICDREGREMLYLLCFYLPRFLDLSLEEKIATTCHELWHIGPEFDGDLRRHESDRYYAHGPCEKRFHAAMHVLAKRWMQLSASTDELCEPLRHNFGDLQARHGRIFGMRIATPKLVRVG